MFSSSGSSDLNCCVKTQTTAPFASSFQHNYDCESSGIANGVRYGDWAHCKSNMWEENSGSPCSLKYASSASNMPQIAGTSLSLAPKIRKVHRQSKSSCPRYSNTSTKKKTIRPTNPNAHHAKHFLHKNYSNYNSAVFFPCYCTMVDCGVWTGECRARSVECTVEMCGM